MISTCSTRSGSHAAAAGFLFQVPMGWVSDRIGRKPVLLGGLTIHGSISLLYLLAPDTPTFMVLRFIEGIEEIQGSRGALSTGTALVALVKRSGASCRKL